MSGARGFLIRARVSDAFARYHGPDLGLISVN